MDSIDLPHLTAIGIVWLLLFLLFAFISFKKCFESKPKIGPSIGQKGISPNDRIKDLPHYLLKFIFSHPTSDFKFEDTVIRLELIHRKLNADIVYKIALIEIKDCTNNLEVNRDLCCFKYYRFSAMTVRKSYFPNITLIRASHNCPGNSEIFLVGVEVNDQTTGKRMFFNVYQKLVNIDLMNAKVMRPRPQVLSFISKEIFCPPFYSLSFETIGSEIGGSITGDKSNGIIVKPKLNWFEEWLLFVLLINMTLFLILLLTNLFGESTFILNRRILVSIILIISGVFSNILTELIAIVYRSIRTKFNDKQSSNFYGLILIVAIIIIIGISILATVFDIRFLKGVKLNKYLDCESIDETLVLLLILAFSLISLATVGSLVLAFIRYLFHVIFRQQNRRETVDIEKNLTMSTALTETSDTSTVISDPLDKLVERKERGATLEEIKQVTENTPSDESKQETSVQRDKMLESSGYDSKGYEIGGPKLIFNTTRLDKDAKDKDKTKRLVTNSVIAKPTKSKGYEDPEQFRQTHSKIDKDKKLNRKK